MKQKNTTFRSRILATVLDYGLFLACCLYYILEFGHTTPEGFGVEGLETIPIIVVWFIYFVLVEGVFGATLGYQAYQLRVRTMKNEKISISHSFKRHLLDPIDILLYGIPAYIAIKNSEMQQRLGDMCAGTIVVSIKENDDK